MKFTPLNLFILDIGSRKDGVVEEQKYKNFIELDVLLILI